MEYTVHPTAVVDEGAQIGAGTRIWHWVHVSSGAKIGKSCSLGQNVFVGDQVVIGNNVKIQNNVSVYDAVVLEDDVFCGPSMVFTNVINPRSHVVRKHEYRVTRVGRGATIGANATLICGNNVGAYAMIGAGAVITRAVPAYALMLGNPARRAGWVCRCGIKLEASSGTCNCSSCGTAYQIEGEKCTPLEIER